MNTFIAAWNDLDRAKVARLNGDEGKARVLSRLAAAAAIRIHLIAAVGKNPSGNVIEVIRNFAASDALPDVQKASLEHLCMRVDEGYNLPLGIDLIEETALLIHYFESDKK